MVRFALPCVVLLLVAACARSSPPQTAEVPATALPAGDPRQVDKAALPYRPAGELGATEATRCGRLTNFCLTADGRGALICDAGAGALLHVGLDDSLRARWVLDFAPEAVAVAADGCIHVAGGDQVATLDGEGRVLARGSLRPPRPATAAATPSADTAFAQWLAKKSAAARAEVDQIGPVTSMACTPAGVHVVARRGNGFTVFLLSADLSSAQPLLTDLRGCCGQLDIAGLSDGLLLAANCKFQVQRYDAGGALQLAFGEGSETDPAGFDGCCEPMNVAVSPDGLILTSEASGRVKAYTMDGTFLGVLALVPDSTGCKRVDVAMTPDCCQLLILDQPGNRVRRYARAEPES